jgi:hypothetical protein
MIKHTQWPILAWVFLALLLAGCESGNQPVALPDVLPKAGTVPGWTPSGDVRTFNRENIYDLVDGQADAYFVYGFEQVAVCNYQNAAGAVLGVEVWQLATPADAYGLYTASFSGQPVALGNDGDADPGRRLAFWQNRYYVRVRARQELPDTGLRAFGGTVAAALPTGGERPALVNRLPRDRRVENSTLFFHEEVSIQGEVWLGGENVLGLSAKTDGVLARYDFGGQIVRLLVVQYPDAQAASSALGALQSARVEGFVTARVRGNLLGAVFGPTDKPAADALLVVALQ